MVKILPTTPTCFSLSRPSSGSFVLPYFEVANASMLNIYGTAAACVSCTGRTPAKEHRHNLHNHTHAAAVPYILSIEALATSK